MKLKARTNKIEDLPLALQGFYEKPEGSEEYLLRLEGKPAGFISKSEHDSFRENNNNLKNQNRLLEEQLRAFDGVDPEEAQQALKQHQALKEKKLIEEGNVETLIQEKTQSLLKHHESEKQHLLERVKASESERSTLKKRLSNLTIETTLLSAIHEFGIPKKNTLPFIKIACQKAWCTDDEGSLTLKDSNDVLQIRGGLAITTPSEWAKQFVKQFTGTLFEGNEGGSTPKSHSSATTAVNPWKAESFNLTEQGNLVQNHPKLAKRLKSEAGITG